MYPIPASTFITMKSQCNNKEFRKCFGLVDTFGILGTYWYFHRTIAMIGAAMEETPICQKANETLSLSSPLFYLPKASGTCI